MNPGKHAKVENSADKKWIRNAYRNGVNINSELLVVAFTIYALLFKLYTTGTFNVRNSSVSRTRA